jgi:dihydroxy-acid dehydratase
LLKEADVKDDNLIKTVTTPVAPAPTIAIVSGNLAPKGAVIKVAAASTHLLVHTGKAVVFENYDDMLNRIDDDNLTVDQSSVLVLRNAGPKPYRNAGMGDDSHSKKIAENRCCRHVTHK